MSKRRLVHTRSIRAEVYARDDGLWDVEAELIDTKTRDIPLLTGVRKAGDPIHHMRLVVTIDTQYNVVEAKAHSVSVPYMGSCERVEPDYAKLIGLNLLKNFRQDVRRRLGDTRGCTHMTELTNVMPTAAVQAFAGEVSRVPPGMAEADVMPWQLDRCFALRLEGPTVAEYYPRWFRAAPASTESDDGAAAPTQTTAEERS